MMPRRFHGSALALAKSLPINKLDGKISKNKLHKQLMSQNHVDCLSGLLRPACVALRPEWNGTCKVASLLSVQLILAA